MAPPAISVSLSTGTIIGIVMGSILGCLLLTCYLCLFSCIYCPKLRKYRDVLERHVAARDRQQSEEANLLAPERELSSIDKAKACAKVAVAADQAGLHRDAALEYANAIELIETALSHPQTSERDVRELRTFRTAYVTRVNALMDRVSPRKTAPGDSTAAAAKPVSAAAAGAGRSLWGRAEYKLPDPPVGQATPRYQ